MSSHSKAAEIARQLITARLDGSDDLLIAAVHALNKLDDREAILGLVHVVHILVSVVLNEAEVQHVDPMVWWQLTAATLAGVE